MASRGRHINSGHRCHCFFIPAVSAALFRAFGSSAFFANMTQDADAGIEIVGETSSINSWRNP